jgi:hypothetical protein
MAALSSMPVGGRAGVPRQHGGEGLAGAGPQVEHRRNGDARGGPDDLLLQPRVARDLSPHELHVRRRVEMELAHPARMQCLLGRGPAGGAPPGPEQIVAGDRRRNSCSRSAQ